MAVIKTNLRCDLQKAVEVQYLRGNLFSQDVQANEINVAVLDGGEPAAISGTVTAKIIRSDGGTVSATGGTISGNIASITLPAAAYAVPGVVSITVQLTASGVITTIAAVVTNIYKTSTEATVDPGTIIPSVTALISDIEAAVASIPADYSSLWTSLAPAFSSSASYTPGQYVTYDGALYVCTATHSGSWVAGHFAATNLGAGLSELKSAVSDAFESKIDIDAIANGYDLNINQRTLWDTLGGGIDVASGNNVSASGQLRTVGYIPDDVDFVSLNSGAYSAQRFILFAYDGSNVYKGAYYNGNLSTSNSSRLTSANMTTLHTNYPGYKWRMSMYGGSAALTQDDYKDVMFYAKGRTVALKSEVEAYDNTVKPISAVKIAEQITLTSISGSLSGSVGNSISVSSSSAFDYSITDVAANTTYIVKTNMAKRSTRSNSYVYGTDANGIIKEVFLPVPNPLADTLITDYTFITTGSETTKLYIQRYIVSGVYAELYSVGTYYGNHASGIFDLLKKIESNNSAIQTNATAITGKVDKVTGKGLSTNDFTDYYKELIESGVSEQQIIDAVDAYISEHPTVVANVPTLQTVNVSVTVGTGGDYQTVNAALDALSRMHQIMNITATITLKTGFVLNEQVIADSTDFSWVTIVSEDNEVSVNASAITAVTVAVPAHSPYEAVNLVCALTARNNGALPKIGVLFSYGSAASGKYGIGVYNGGRVYVKDGCGVKYGQVGIYLTEHGYANCMGAVFTNSVGNNISCFRSSSIVFGGGDGTNAGHDGIYVDSNSNAEISGADFSGAHVSGASTLATYGKGVEVGPGCMVQAQGTIADNCDVGLWAYNGGIVTGREFHAAGCYVTALYGQNGAKISLPSSTLTGCGGRVVFAEFGSDININSSDLRGRTNSASPGCTADRGSIIRLVGAKCQKVDSDATNDIQCTYGSMIFALYAEGGTNITPNTIPTTGQGLIFRPTS